MNPALLKPPLLIACLVPLVHYAWGAHSDTLGIDPVEGLRRGLGIWALNFLLITLAVTPLRKYSGWAWLGRLRRMLGLFAFFYATLHLLSYPWLDQSFALTAMAVDIAKRPFIIAGLIAFILLLPLALTSNAYAVGKLGGRRWLELHRSVYLVAMLALAHMAWMTEAGPGKPLLYALALAILLGLRIHWRVQELRYQQAGGIKHRRRVIPVILKK